MLAQQGGGPNRGVISVVSRVVIDHCVNEVVNDSLHRGWPTAPGSIQKTFCRREPAPLLKPTGPAVYSLPAHLHMFRNLFDVFAVVQQHQSQGTSILPVIVGRFQQALTLVSFPGSQPDDELVHLSLHSKGAWLELMSKNFLPTT